jgi:tetratricopeptide (TPR) repeat protein
MNTPTTSPAEQLTRKKLLFALHHRQKPTVVFIQCQSNAKRDELELYLRDELREYQFVGLDVTPLSVTSLVRTLSDKLPETVKTSTPVRYVVNVRGLENRLDENLAAQLNLERELLFRGVPYITVIWADAYFFRKLQNLAPDLWHWVTYKFRFEDPTVTAPEQQVPLPAAVLSQKGNIGERQARIQSLEERYAHLNLDESNKIRLLRDKVSTLSLLAGEYMEAFEFGKAIEAYETAIALETQLQEVAGQEQTTQAAQSSVAQTEEIQPDSFLLGQLLFNLGWAYLKSRSFERALVVYHQSKALVPAQAGTIYHQIGIVHAAQRQWAEALDNYRQALQWKGQTGNTFALGNTYHQIGMVYAEQRQWAEALDNYRRALHWYEQTGNTFELGGTYHQIGRVYEEQRQWAEALDNYRQALQWKEQTGNTFELGNTYHQIGMVYEKQLEWAEALDNYRQALQWKEQTGNTFELGSTYHQIGRVYEEKVLLPKALEWLEKSLLNLTTHSHPGQPVAEESVARVREKLAVAVSPK